MLPARDILIMETRNCQNCKNDFSIEAEDFKFYEKIKVPPPTFCYWCRFIRRMMWRNERALYRRSCDLCQKKIIAIYSTEESFPVYCRDCWYSDNWEATNWGQDYDFSRPFFEQFRDLMNKIPRLALGQRNAINSEYSNMVADSRNVYLSVSTTLGSENVFYSKSIDASFNILDSYNLKSCEGSYEDLYGENNYNVEHSYLSRNCIDSYFITDCTNCSNCFMCSNLRNKKFCIRNEQYSREDYFKELEKYNLGSREARESLKAEYDALQDKCIWEYANMSHTVNSSGDNLRNTKNCFQCFDIYDSEDCRYCYRAYGLKECVDFDFGTSAEFVYEYSTFAKGLYNVRFSLNALNEVRDAEYTDHCISGKNLFGCIGVKNKSNVILNKEYSEKDFLALRERIVAHMSEMPYEDKRGIVFTYGEFFPIELSPHSYNESLAQEFAPLSREDTLDRGYRWKEDETKDYAVTLVKDNIPDDIKSVSEAITEEVLGCEHAGLCSHQCTEAFKITPGELQLYKKQNIPIPIKCPNCRYFERYQKIAPPLIFPRSCSCDLENHGHEGKCENVFETAHVSSKKTKVFCEDCYNKEIY